MLRELMPMLPTKRRQPAPEQPIRVLPPRMQSQAEKEPELILPQDRLKPETTRDKEMTIKDREKPTHVTQTDREMLPIQHNKTDKESTERKLKRENHLSKSKSQEQTLNSFLVLGPRMTS